jgi:hypothetical protein
VCLFSLDFVEVKLEQIAGSDWEFDNLKRKENTWA